ncbi:class IV adenylate cyclase [Terriglobus sp. TAA 43]|uniref:class IV adenylate cyclase n=1 Tax=Terriglobus sp. TAA 43 TaxID=278961 RepID=UPI000646F6EF|nr:class IV adenylate cyclase [Terriglobus sp. TAA 43]
MQHAEIELKFRVGDAREFHARALRAGFQIHTERTLERNTLFDTSERRLLSERQILRLREYNGRNLLTHKKPPADNDDTSFYKERVETETDVADPDALATVFVELGYGPVFRYEKFRTEFRDGQGELLLDETPIGIFAELEGTPDWIDRALERLNVSRELCFTDSYGRMFLDWKQRSASLAENMTFEEIESSRALV